MSEPRTKERSNRIERTFVADAVGRDVYLELWFPPDNDEPMWNVAGGWIRGRERLEHLRDVIDAELERHP